MWKICHPTSNCLQRFLSKQTDAGFSYSHVGQTEHGAWPAHFDHDINRIQLGVGPNVYESACEALRQWRQFPSGWTRIYPEGAPIAVGATVAMVARAYCQWWINACRIVYVVDEHVINEKIDAVVNSGVARPESAKGVESLAQATPFAEPQSVPRVRRFGYAYGTLHEHVESGEERFLIEELADGSVWYDLRAFSRPRLWCVRLAYPLARRLQRRFVRDSQRAMQAAVASHIEHKT